MNHEMNTLAIGRQEAFSTMVSNKVPATAHCLSDGIHKAKESCGEQKGWGRQGIVGKDEGLVVVVVGERGGRETRWKTQGLDGVLEKSNKKVCQWPFIVFCRRGTLEGAMLISFLHLRYLSQSSLEQDRVF